MSAPRARLAAFSTALVAACGPDLRTLPAPPGGEPTELLSVAPPGEGEPATFLFPRGEGFLAELPDLGGAVEAGLYAEPLDGLLLDPPAANGRVELVEAARGLAPDRVFAWSGTDWTLAAPKQLAGLGLPVLSGRACLQQGGCWLARPATGWGVCKLGCTLDAEPEAPEPPRLLPVRAALTATEAEARAAACFANVARMDPRGVCVPIGAAACEPPPPAVGRVFVSPDGAGEGATADRPTSLAAAARGAEEWVLLPGEYAAGELSVTRPILIQGVCTRGVIVRGDLVISADLTLSELQWEGDVRHGGGAPTIELRDVSLRRGPVGEGPDWDLYGFLGPRVVLRRSYVGPLPPAPDAAERRRSFGIWPSGTERWSLRIESSTLVGGLGVEVQASADAPRPGTFELELVDSVVVSGGCHAGLTLRRGVRAEVRGSLVVGGRPTGPQLGTECPPPPDAPQDPRRPLAAAVYLDRGARLELTEVEVLGSGGVGVADRAALVARGLRIREALSGLTAAGGASITAADLDLLVGPPRGSRESTIGYAGVAVASSTLSLTRVTLAGSVDRFVDVFRGVTPVVGDPPAGVEIRDLRVTAAPAPLLAREVFRVVEQSALTLERVRVDGLGGVGLGGIAFRIESAEVVARDLVVAGGDPVACSAMRSLCLAAGVRLVHDAALTLERARFEAIDRGFEMIGTRYSVRLTDVETRAVACPVNDGRGTDGALDPLTELATLRTDDGEVCAHPPLTPRP